MMTTSQVAKTTGLDQFQGEFFTQLWRVDLPHVDVAHQPLDLKNVKTIPKSLGCYHASTSNLGRGVFNGVFDDEPIEQKAGSCGVAQS